MVESRPTQVFISYAHADSARLADFRRHFGPVERGRNLTVWFDRNLTAGQAWNDEIRRQINASDIFVCLVSAAFLSSNYIMDTELPAIRQAARGRSALVVPIILEECFWAQEFGEIQCLPKTGKGDLKPVNKWRPKADGYHAAAAQAATAIEARLKTLPPLPVDPGPGVALLVTQDGFDLAPDVPGPAERIDTLQARLLAGLQDLWRELMADAKRACGNSHPILLRNLERYGPLVETPLAELDVVALTTAGSALDGLVEAVAAPTPGSMTEPLEPEIRAGFETLLREHARLVMGFAEGREMIARDGLMKQLLDDPPAARRTLHDALKPMITMGKLLTRRARDLMQSIDDGLIEAGVISLDALASAVRQGGFAIASIARAVGRKIGSPANAVTYATFSAIMAGDPNLETYQAAFSYLHGNAAQLLAFAAHQPELRRLIDWTLEQFGERERPSLAVASGIPGKGNDVQDKPPPDFDMEEVKAMIIRGEAPPQNWAPWIRELSIVDEGDLVDLSPLSGLTALQSLDCGGTSVSDLAPLCGLTALQSLRCQDTLVSDLAPLSGLTALRSLNCSDTSVSDLAPLSGLTNLRTLRCLSTAVSDLGPLSGRTELQELNCSDTFVSDLGPLSGLTALRVLFCSHTLVSDLGPLSGLKTLQELHFGETSVSDLGPLSGLTALHALGCWSTSVWDLSPLSGLTALQTIGCAETFVSDLYPLSGLELLRTLDCSWTLVSNLESLSDLPALKCLYLDGLGGGVTNAEWFADERLVELVLLGTALDRPVERWATYQIDPDGTVHDPDGAASASFHAYVEAANRRAETPSRPD